jgi:glutamine synthetase
MLAAGLKGIENNYPLPEPVEQDIYHMTEAQRADLGIRPCPAASMRPLRRPEKASWCGKP